jgi:hypothetical protein
MSVRVPPHQPPATKSGRADCASYRRPRPGQRLDQPKRRMREGPEAAAQQARLAGREAKEEGRGEE